MEHQAQPGQDPPRTAAIRVMICDDSAVVRTVLARILETDSAIAVVSRVAHGQQALDALRVQAIDVLLLDIEMPVMDGMTALPLLLRADPTLRIIMSSALTTRGAEVALHALRLGASDYIAKPATGGRSTLGTRRDDDPAFCAELIQKVKGLGLTRHRHSQAGAPAAPGLGGPGLGVSGLGGVGAAPHISANIVLRRAPATPPLVLAIGSSTGGPQALFTLVHDLGTDLSVPVVATQHMPAAFTPILAEHISRLGGLPCAEAKDGEKLLPGRIYLAPGDRHLLVAGFPGMLHVRLSDEPAENYCRPSLDPMLRSLAQAAGGRALLLMLTGMGHDGREGTRRLVEAGGAAIAQDEASSVVWGMPGAIAHAGLCTAVLPLQEMGRRVRDILRMRP